MLMKNYTYLKDGFEGKLYDAQNGDDRLLIVIQGLKGLELPENTPSFFPQKAIPPLPCSITVRRGSPPICAPYLLSSSRPLSTV